MKDISLNTTELATLDNVQVIVPNAQVWGSIITNYSVYDTRRAEWTFGVSYGSNLATAEKVIRDTILSDTRALKDPEPFCQVNNLGDSSSSEFSGAGLVQIVGQVLFRGRYEAAGERGAG